MAVGEQIRQAAPVPQFSQTAFIFGVLAFAFLLFVTIRGHLPKWLGLFGFGGSPTNTPGMSTPGTNTAGGALPDATQPGTYGNVVPFPSLPQLGTVPS